MPSNLPRRILMLTLLATAAPALAQEEEAVPDDPNSLTIGVGGAWRPSYEGSDDYTVGPIGLVFGKVGGFGFATRGTNLSIDLIRDGRDRPFSIDFGPLVHVRLDRTGGIKDPQVRALGEIDTAVEIGLRAAIKKNGVLHDYDSLGIGLTWQTDVSDTHGSSLLSPSIDYETPLSTRTFLSLGASMDRVGDGYATTYFSVSPAGSTASGLPAFNAQGGWKSTRFSLFAGQVLTGDLRNPGLSLFGGLSYSKLRGDFKRSPIVSIAGDADQYLALAGLSYTF